MKRLEKSFIQNLDSNKTYDHHDVSTHTLRIFGDSICKSLDIILVKRYLLTWFLLNGTNEKLCSFTKKLQTKYYRPSLSSSFSTSML